MPDLLQIRVEITTKTMSMKPRQGSKVKFTIQAHWSAYDKNILLIHRLCYNNKYTTLMLYTLTLLHKIQKCATGSRR